MTLRSRREELPLSHGSGAEAGGFEFRLKPILPRKEVRI
jgi:hypothetical protein